MELDRPPSPAIRLFRDSGGPGLVIPAEYGGLGASALDAIRCQRAVAVRSPSLAVATTMHHFSVATLVEMAAGPHKDMEWLVLEGIAHNKLLVASGFAEGRTGSSIFSSQFEVRRSAEGLVLNGSKKPCSLAASMDLLTVSLTLPAQPRAEGSLVVALLPSSTPGVSIRTFWGSWVLAGAESEEVVLQDVAVPESMLAYWGRPDAMDTVQRRSFLWFELLIAASYLGVASALVERVFMGKRGTATERAELGTETEGAMAALEGVARAMDSGEAGEDLLARALMVRFAVQAAIERTTARAAELLGGLAFVTSSDVAYFLAAGRALAFHPPSRLSAAPALDAYLTGGPLRLD